MRADTIRRVVLVTGLSGGGKASILRALEDVGYEAVDNPPLPMLEDLVRPRRRTLAIGVDARTRGFDAGPVLEALERLRRDASAASRTGVTPGPTKRRCCAATPRPAGAIRWRRRAASPTASRGRSSSRRHCGNGPTWSSTPRICRSVRCGS